jgi:hypothetical protein
MERMSVPADEVFHYSLYEFITALFTILLQAVDMEILALDVETFRKIV